MSYPQLISGVYEILNTVNGKRYIGSARSLIVRINEHVRELRGGTHSNKHLQHAWDLYGEAAFDCRPLLLCSPANLLMYEQRALDAFQPEYNIAKNAAAPFLGRKHTPQDLEKMRAAGKARVIPPEHIEAMVAANRGRRLTPEHRAKLSASLIGNTRKRGKIQGPHSLEHRRKIVAANTGKVFTFEHRAHISAAKRAAYLAKVAA